jgi:ABC-type multidrug transport system ATPase subunit
MTVRENLEFITSSYGGRVPDIPADLARYTDVLVGSMPLGAQRQAAFLAALSHKPEGLLLDEPTSGVDALSRASLWDTIREQSDQGVGVLVTTHYMQEAQQCDRLLLMSNGQLVADGSESDIIGDTRALAVHTDNWATTFAALNAADVPVILDGRAVRVVDTDQAELEAVLRQAGIDAIVTTAPATLEERMLVLARHSNTR